MKHRSNLFVPWMRDSTVVLQELAAATANEFHMPGKNGIFMLSSIEQQKYHLDRKRYGLEVWFIS